MPVSKLSICKIKPTTALGLQKMLSLKSLISHKKMISEAGTYWCYKQERHLREKSRVSVCKVNCHIYVPEPTLIKCVAEYKRLASRVSGEKIEVILFWNDIAMALRAKKMRKRNSASNICISLFIMVHQFYLSAVSLNCLIQILTLY